MTHGYPFFRLDLLAPNYSRIEISPNNKTTPLSNISGICFQFVYMESLTGAWAPNKYSQKNEIYVNPGNT